MPFLLFLLSALAAHYSDGSTASAMAFLSGLLLASAVQSAR